MCAGRGGEGIQSPPGSKQFRRNQSTKATARTFASPPPRAGKRGFLPSGGKSDPLQSPVES